MIANNRWLQRSSVRQVIGTAEEKQKREKRKFTKNWVDWEGISSRIEQANTMLAQFECEYLDPWLDKAFSFWGDLRSKQQASINTSSEPSNQEERQINRGLYVTASSLGISVIGTLFFPPLRLLSIPGFLYGSWHVYKAAYLSLSEKRTVDNHVLMALVNTAYIGTGMWVLANMSVASHFGNAKLLNVVKDRFQSNLRTVLALRSQNVWVLENHQEVQRHLHDLQIGDKVVVGAGEVIPVDGVVKQGFATIDQHVLTGESRPVEKSSGDVVFASTVVLTGKLYIVLEQSGSETTVSRINEILNNTVNLHATRQLQSQQITDRLVLPSLGLALLTYPFLGATSAAAVIDCHPFRQLTASGSLGLLNHLVLATEQGILVKDGRSFEVLRKVDTLVLDKTGTLTEEQPQVIAIHRCAAYDQDHLLAYAAAAEQRQSHPIARALLTAAELRKITPPAIDQSSFQSGFGLSVLVEGAKVCVGSARFMAMEQIAIPPLIEEVQARCQEQGHSLVLLAVDGQLAGAFELRSSLRPEAKTVIHELRRTTNIRSVIIISGDHPVPTRQLAHEIGADLYFAEVLPAQKAELVQKLQEEGRTICYIGDGINDTVALKQANVSISLAGAATAATDTAHIVLMDESLTQLIPLFELVKKFTATARNTTFAVLGTSVAALMGIYTLGWGLAATTVLDQVSLTLGMGAAMQPWFQRKQWRIIEPQEQTVESEVI